MSAKVFGVMIVCLLAAGCEEDLNSIYGQRQGLGAGSVNGTAVWAEMFEKAGHTVISMRQLSPRLRKRAEVIVWRPTTSIRLRTRSANGSSAGFPRAPGGP